MEEKSCRFTLASGSTQETDFLLGGAFVDPEGISSSEPKTRAVR
jgi:hypothetical protein